MASDHPLGLELGSLKAALERYQAAHISSLQLQRAFLEASDAHAQSKLLETENARLKQEITFLRSNPEPPHAPRQINELSLALRRVSDKLSHTEGTLVQRTTELAQSMSEKMAIQHEVNVTRAEADRIRQTQFESRSRERELQRECKVAEEQARMVDAVVLEYAELVRSLEGRIPKTHDGSELAHNRHSGVIPSSSSPQTRSNNLIRSLTESRYSLQRLLHEFNSEASDLQSEITRIHNEFAATQIQLDAEREISRQERSKLAEALIEVERWKADDATASKIVSRYMRFSQSSIDMLQTALSTLKSRHAMTLATISSSNEALSQALELERKRAAQLRNILDELTQDISRETFGRRREVALRLQGVVREERTSEAISVWLRRAEEHRGRLSTHVDPSFSHSPSELLSAFDHMIEDAHVLRASLSFVDHSISDFPGCTSWERVLLAEHTCRSLLAELQGETEKRLALTKMIGETLNILPPASQQNMADTNQNSDQSTTIKDGLLSSDASPTSPVGFENHAVYSPDSPHQPVNCITNERHEKISNTTPPDKQDDIPKSPAAFENHDEALNVGETLIAAYCPLPFPAAEERSAGSNHLIDELTHVSHRYEHLQRSFRDCHVALSQLKTNVSLETASRLDKSVLKNVVHRLDDFCEDVRVELEIRMADEERIAQGYDTMLRVPGALAVANGEEARRELQSFLDGTAPTVVKAREAYTKKLADLQHDIAQVKRVFHELEASSETQVQHTKTSPVWPSWTPFLSTPPKRSSSPAPTFGTVITTPRSTRMSSFSSRSSNESTQAVNDMYANLELRIPMPSQTHAHSSPIKSPLRLRNSAASGKMYLLGLGSSKSSLVSTQDLIPELTLGHGRENDSDIQDNHSDVE